LANLMPPTLIPAAVFVAISAIGILGLRRFSATVRLAFDVIGFAAMTVFLVLSGIVPLFPPLTDAADSTSWWLRTIGGAWWLLGARVLVALLTVTFRRDRHSREASIASDLMAAAIYVAAALIVLNSVLALPIAGLLATSGVLAIVLGLALQNTLADVFAGIAVGIEAPFSIGDRIQVGDRIEGQVTQVNWRSIRVHTDGDDMAIIPNSLVAKAEIVNRSFPSQRRAVSVEVSCPHTSPPERVTEALRHATLLCPDIVQTPAPTIVLTRLGERRNAFSISFVVESSKYLGATKGAVLEHAQRELHHAGLLERADGDMGASGPHRRVPQVSARRMLQDLLLFESLDPGQLDRLAEQIEIQELESDEVLFEQGQSDATLYVLASGVLALTRRFDAEIAETLGCIGAGDYVGEMGLLTGAPHAGTATARTRCQVYKLSREAIAPLLEERSELTSALERSVRHGLAAVNRRVAARATERIKPGRQFLDRIRRYFGHG
jgi:small-conductance mechanosensitive channel/CRP-like cAMP-binding protein